MISETLKLEIQKRRYCVLFRDGSTYSVPSAVNGELRNVTPDYGNWLNVYARVSYHRLATGWTVRGSNPGGGEICRTCPDRPWGPPSLLYNGTGSFAGVKSGQGAALTPHPLLVRGYERVELYLYSPYGPYGLYTACARVHFPAKILYTFAFASPSPHTKGLNRYYLNTGCRGLVINFSFGSIGLSI
jgi:hypothetical protein